RRRAPPCPAKRPERGDRHGDGSVSAGRRKVRGDPAVLEAARMVPGLALSITTKSTLVSRDAVLLREISAASDVTVNLSITTVDPALARRLEPRAPRPDLRFDAMKALADAGVAARLFIMPIRPRLTDAD